MIPLGLPISETCLKKLVGRTDIEDALKKLDKLTADEVWMVAAQGLKEIKCVSNNMKVIEDKVTEGTCIDSTNNLCLSGTFFLFRW